MDVLTWEDKYQVGEMGVLAQQLKTRQRGLGNQAPAPLSQSEVDSLLHICRCVVFPARLMQGDELVPI